MKKNSLHRAFFCVSIVLGATFTILVSCSTKRSVREVKINRQSDPILQLSPHLAKTPEYPKEAMVKPLFFQSKRVTIDLPQEKGGKRGSGVLSERVTYSNAEVISKKATRSGDKVDLSKDQQLGEVVVTARSRFAPERDGRVSVDFVVKIPKEMFATNWAITLNPVLLHNDSVIPLKHLVFKGREFSNRQKADYKSYDEYLKSIVKESDYDKHFLDTKSVSQDIKDRQNFFYEQYHREWSKYITYDKWKVLQGGINSAELARLKGIRNRLYHEYARKASEESIRNFAKGKDTTGVYAKHMKEFDKHSKRIVMLELGVKRHSERVPSKFKELLESGLTLDDIINNAVTAKDSIDISKNRYLYDQIALNEMKDARREEVFKEMVVFPYSEGARTDTVLRSTKRDFTYYYKQDYPVTPGLKKLRITMSGVVDAIDRSRYTMQPMDTLSYFISSLSQLVDTSLIFKRTTLHRDLFNSMTIYPKFAPGKAVFNINFKDNKEQIAKVMEAYSTFNGSGKFVMDSIMIRVATSLDGPYDKNYEITEKRSLALKEYFSKNEPSMAAVLRTRHIGEDWNSLATHIKRSRNIPNKEGILEILTTAVYPDNTEADIKKKYPADFKIITDSIYPLLQKADIIFNMHRPNMTEEVMEDVQERPGYEQALQLLRDREYWKAMEILADYPDYNTALCLVCMGYNAKALELLDQLEETGNTEYLRAILAIRSNEHADAVQYLRRACELDPTKVYRVPLDPEVNDLVRTQRIDLSKF